MLATICCFLKTGASKNLISYYTYYCYCTRIQYSKQNLPLPPESFRKTRAMRAAGRSDMAVLSSASAQKCNPQSQGGQICLKSSVESDFLTNVVVKYSVHTIRKLIFLQIFKILAIAASL